MEEELERSLERSRLMEEELERSRLNHVRMRRGNFFVRNLESFNKIYNGRNFSGKNFSERNLDNAVFHSSDLRGANFSGATLDYAGFVRSKLSPLYVTKRNITNTINSNFSYAILRNAFFTNANLRGANLQGAILTNANLRGAILTNANLRGAILTNADLQDAILINANLTNITDLEDANLTNALLQHANLQGAILTNANLTNANLTNANLTNALLQHANLTNANLRGANLQGARLEGARLEGARLEGARLEGAVLTNTILAPVNLAPVNPAPVNPALSYEIHRAAESNLDPNNLLNFLRDLPVHPTETFIKYYEIIFNSVIERDEFSKNLFERLKRARLPFEEVCRYILAFIFSQSDDFKERYVNNVIQSARESYAHAGDRSVICIKGIMETLIFKFIELCNESDEKLYKDIVGASVNYKNRFDHYTGLWIRDTHNIENFDEMGSEERKKSWKNYIKESLPYITDENIDKFMQERLEYNRSTYENPGQISDNTIMMDPDIYRGGKRRKATRKSRRKAIRKSTRKSNYRKVKGTRLIKRVGTKRR